MTGQDRQGTRRAKPHSIGMPWLSGLAVAVAVGAGVASAEPQDPPERILAAGVELRELGLQRRADRPLLLVARTEDGRRVAHLFARGESISSKVLLLDQSTTPRNSRALLVPQHNERTFNGNGHARTASVGAPDPLAIRSSIPRVASDPGPPQSSVKRYNGTVNGWAFRDLIQSAAQRHDVPQALIRAVMHSESSFDPKAISSAGAAGLMQLMPATAERFGVTDRFDPAQNVEGGVRYLRFLLDRFNGDARLAIAAYNAGEGAVDRHGGIPPFRETQDFVVRVTERWVRYQQDMEG